MKDFDFDIRNYTIANIENLFKFTTSNYTEDEIHTNVAIMKDKLLACNSLTNEITVFLDKAREMLLINIDTKPTPPTTPITYNLIQPKPVDIHNVYNYKYKTGLVNPIERQVQTKSLCINSLFRTNYFNSDPTSFDYIIPIPIENVISMKVSFIEIPNFWYNISSKRKNNSLTIKLFNMRYLGIEIDDITHTIIIEDGNYSSFALSNYFNNYFFTHGQGLNFLIMTIREVNAKVIIRAKSSSDNDQDGIAPFDVMSNSYSPDFKFQIIFNDTSFSDTSSKNQISSSYSKNSANILGFKLNEYTLTGDNEYISHSLNVTYKCYLESEFPYGNYQYEYLFLEVNDYHNNFTTNSVISLVGNNNYISDNIIAVIPITGGSNTITFNDSRDGINKCREYFGPIKLNKISIRILNQYGEVVDLNGYDYFTILEIQQLYNNYTTPLDILNADSCGRRL